jgi:ABC-2 type transport system ATP-binding protein
MLGLAAAPAESIIGHVPVPAAAPATIVELAGVSKRLGKSQALDDVSFVVRQGEVVALLGPNGAGKTTAVDLITGLRTPDRGEVLLFGGDPRVPASRTALGVTPQEMTFPPTLTVRETVQMISVHFEKPIPSDVLLHQFALDHLAKRKTGSVSIGERRRLAIAVAFLGMPALVVLDEPTAGLDVEVRRAVWQGIRRFAEFGGTVLLSTHHMEEVEALATRVVVLGRGHVRADDTVEAIRQRASARSVRFRAPHPPAVEETDVVTFDGTRYAITTTDADRIVRALVLGRVDFSDVEVTALSLEDAFLAVTGAHR